MAAAFSLPEKVAFLRDPASYPECADGVTSIETHFAWVFLAGPHAYKMKKPVRHQELDYRALSAREWGCREELRLNRRLAPTIYDSVIPLSSTARGNLQLGPAARVEDWLVKMQRLPAANMLDEALRRDTLNDTDAERVAETLVRFFSQASTNPVEPAQYLKALAARIAENKASLRSYGARIDLALVECVCSAQLRFLASAEASLGQRGARVVEGHGDLRAEHVYLGPPVAVIDCLEFSRELRLLDPAEEIAQLALEVEAQNAPFSQAILERFCALSPQPPEPCILDFYMSHRAITRAKLAAWHLDDPQFTNPKPWLERAHRLLAEGLRHAVAALETLECPQLRRASM